MTNDNFNIAELKAAAEEAKKTAPYRSFSQNSLHDAMEKFAGLDDTAEKDDIIYVLRTNLGKLIENPHNPYINAQKAIEAAKWFAEQTGDGLLGDLARKAATVKQLSFAEQPEINIYSE